MKPLKRRPKKGLAAEIDGQWWRIESQTSYLKAVLLMRERVAFYEYGELHRSDGPAIIWIDGHETWRLNERERRSATNHP